MRRRVGIRYVSISLGPEDQPWRLRVWENGLDSETYSMLREDSL